MNTKWEATGLLTNLSEVYKEILSETLDNCYNEMINDKKRSPEFSSITFPLARRIFDDKGLKMDYFKAKTLYLETKKEIFNKLTPDDTETKIQMWERLFNDQEEQIELVEFLSASY